jgi:hypothetical protein
MCSPDDETRAACFPAWPPFAHFLISSTPPGSGRVLLPYVAKRELRAMMHEAVRRMQMEFWKGKGA